MTAAKRPRLEKRKQATRLRLMESAYALMATKGFPDVSIQEITSAADVGFGTFYTYFASKESIYDALVEEVLESSGSVVDAATRHLTDPAERLSAGIQYTLLQARSDVLWGKFLSTSLMTPASAARGLGKFFLRDVLEGLASRRFEVEDVPMSVVAIAGTLDAMLRMKSDELATVLGNLGLQQGGDAAKGHGELDLTKRSAALVLRILGVPAKESLQLASKPLPPIPGFARFFDREPGQTPSDASPSPTLAPSDNKA
ncbi:TetR/AcrR family transcriptional regulator [Aquabacterium sp.]|uniref:TetR/AcrR family transcriptional regulator n=1 Tax=Aquabacterium sp. TaxID=1872578 RepID=UPI003D6D03AC